MVEIRRCLLSLLLLLVLALQTGVCINVGRAQSVIPTFSVVNPGPSSNPSKWNASSTVRYLGTNDFRFYSNETAVNSTFFINVTIENVEQMFGWGIGIVYDGAILQYLSASRPADHVFKGAVDLGYTLVAPTAADEVLNATHRIFKWGCTFINDEANPWSFNGTGTMAQVQFKIVQDVSESAPKAESILGFEADWSAVYYWPSGSDIPIFESGNFSYEYPLVFTPTVVTLAFDPQKISNASLLPQSTFGLNLTAANATKLNNLALDIFYSNTVLECTNAVEGSFLSKAGTTEFNASVVQAFNSTHGKISLSSRLTSPSVGSTGAGVLATLTFKVLANGSTPVVMSVIQLEDAMGNAVGYTILNGFFSNLPTVTGDVNGDGAVDMDDVEIVVVAFGSFSLNSAVHPRWNPIADLNGNGIVDLSDVMIILMNFGKHL